MHSAFSVNVDPVADMCAKLGIDNPWNTPFERLPFDGHGWFSVENEAGLNKIKKDKGEIRVCLELGAWLGKSTRFLAGICDLVVTVDHWLGSQEHQNPHRQDVKHRLPVLHQQFMSNCHEKSSKILPIKMHAATAFEMFTDRGIGRIFDLVYIDASHDIPAVRNDLENSAAVLAEDGVICGDDWTWWGAAAPVRFAVAEFAKQRNLDISVNGDFWRLNRNPVRN